MANVTNSDAELDGKTLVTAEDNQDVDGLKTFARSPAAPFAVEAGSAVVPNLDAALLEGQAMAFYRNAANMNAGLLPDERIRDPLPVRSGENLYNLNATNLVGGLMAASRQWQILTSTATGVHNPLVLAGYVPGVHTRVVWNGVAGLTIHGFPIGVVGQLLIFHNNSSAGWWIAFGHGTASPIANSFSNWVASLLTYVGQNGSIVYQCDGSTWRLLHVAPGRPISYAPAWLSTGAAPTIGNGTLTGGFRVIGTQIKGTLVFQYGSTTAAASGAFLFTVPSAGNALAVANKLCGTAMMFGTSGAFSGVPQLLNPTQIAIFNADVMSNGIMPNIPFVWTTGNNLTVAFEYEVD